MSDELVLTGYAFSVYTRAVRMALAAKGVRYGYAECDPFEQAELPALKELHPFGRVPVLQHGAFRLWETQAILDYVDAAFDGPSLTPETPEARARMRQVMGIVDSYLYWPLVRGVVSNILFVTLEERDNVALQDGLAAAPSVLSALEEIARDALVLRPDHLTLADCLLWPMLDYFQQVPDGAALLQTHPHVTAWAVAMSARPEARQTVPDLTLYERSPA